MYIFGEAYFRHLQPFCIIPPVKEVMADVIPHTESKITSEDNCSQGDAITKKGLSNLMALVS